MRKLATLPVCRPAPVRARVDVSAFASLCKALGDETRVEIVALLAASREPLCACHIEAHFDLAQPTISHHLKILRKAGVLRAERRGTWIHYALDHDVLARLASFPRALGA